MTVTVPDVMRHIRNFFMGAQITGDWQVENGVLAPEGCFLSGEWIAILTGPRTGIWQLDDNAALPEGSDAAWTGPICLLEPPQCFLQLCEDISTWAQAHPDPSLTSESFGEYRRTQKNTDWTEVFAAALAPYTRMYPEVNL